jgi:hypothetical protein
MNVLNYISNSIVTHVKPSRINGIGLFALRDIEIGEDIFKKWEGKTDWYSVKLKLAKKLPEDVLFYILRSFGSDIIDDNSDVRFILTKDCNFLFTEPRALINTKGILGNFDSLTGLVIRKIKKDEEILGTYSFIDKTTYKEKIIKDLI